MLHNGVVARHLRGQVTARHVGVVARVLNVTAHDVVAVVAFWDLVVRVHADLWKNRPEGHSRKGDVGRKGAEERPGLYH